MMAYAIACHVVVSSYKVIQGSELASCDNDLHIHRPIADGNN